MNTHTPGPWVLKHISGSNFAVQRFEIRSGSGMPHPIFNKDTSAIDGTSVCMSPQDANLIAAAPDLYKELSFIVESEEQSSFEQWLSRVAPSGDCESVHSQWLDSSDYDEFCELWSGPLAAIAKARGES